MQTGYTMEQVAAFSDKKFFEVYMQNEKTIKGSVFQLHRKFNLFSIYEREDLLQDVMLQLKHLKKFENYNPELGKLESYLYYQVMHIVQHLADGQVKRVRRNVLMADKIALDKSMKCGKGEVSGVEDLFCKVQPSVKKESIRAFEKCLDEQELEMVRLMIEEDLQKGSDLASKMGTYNMAVSRIRSSLKEKAASFFGIRTA